MRGALPVCGALPGPGQGPGRSLSEHDHSTEVTSDTIAPTGGCRILDVESSPLSRFVAPKRFDPTGVEESRMSHGRKSGRGAVTGVGLNEPITIAP